MNVGVSISDRHRNLDEENEDISDGFVLLTRLNQRR